MKKLLLSSIVAILLDIFATPVAAQVTVPYPDFQPGDDILSEEVDSNFSTLANDALNRTGGTITGNISVSTNITIDGVDISDFFSGDDLTVAGDATIGGQLILGSGAVTLTDATGKIQAISSTYFASLSGANLTSLNASQLSSGLVPNARLDDVVITRPEFTNYRETKATASISSNTLTLDLANGNHFAVALDANITTINFSNVPSSGKAATVTMLFTNDGTTRTITWPASVKWPSGTAPTMTGTNAKVDIVTLYTVDGGTTWYAILGGQNF